MPLLDVSLEVRGFHVVPMDTHIVHLSMWLAEYFLSHVISIFAHSATTATCSEELFHPGESVRVGTSSRRAGLVTELSLRLDILLPKLCSVSRIQVRLSPLVRSMSRRSCARAKTRRKRWDVLVESEEVLRVAGLHLGFEVSDLLRSP